MNNANEIQKSGFSIKTLCENFENITKLDHIEVVGLMNMAPVDASDKELDELFQKSRICKLIYKQDITAS